MSKLLTNALNVKHHTLQKLNYQIIEILENCFQNKTYFSWIKLNSFLLYLKY